MNHNENKDDYNEDDKDDDDNNNNNIFLVNGQENRAKVGSNRRLY